MQKIKVFIFPTFQGLVALLYNSLKMCHWWDWSSAGIKNMFWKSPLERLIILTSSYFKSLSIFMKTAKRSICFPKSRKSLLPFVNHDWTNDFGSKWFSCEMPWSCQPLEHRLKKGATTLDLSCPLQPRG